MPWSDNLESFFWSRNLFEFANSPQVRQHLDDVLGHGGSNGQMVTSGLESVLISNPVDGVGDSVQFVRVRSTGNATNFFGLVTEAFLFSLLAQLDTVGSLEAVSVFAGLINGGSGAEDGNWLFVLSVEFVRVSIGNSHEKGDQKHRFHFDEV